MQRSSCCLVVSLFLVFICSGNVLGGSVLIQVMESGVNVTPVPGALVYSNGTLAGKTDEGGMFEYIIPGTDPVPLRIEKFGYDPWSGSVDANATQILVELERAKMALEIQVFDADTLAPVAGVGVTLEANGVENIAISDSEGIARFPVLAHTSCRILIEKEDYQPIALEVETGNADKNVQVMLFRQDRFALVVKDESTRDPLAGARIFVEGIERGTTDLKGVLTLPLPRGKVYLIKVVRDGYQDYNGRQIVEPDTALLTLPLEKAPYTVFVSVYNEENDPVEGARIFIDDLPAGTTSRYGRVALTNLSAGRYLLEVRHPEYVPATYPLNVSAQGEDIVTELAYPRMNVTIRTIEGSAKPVPLVKITVNGSESGYTDKDGNLSARLRTGIPCTILAEKEGYKPANLVYTPDPSNTTGILPIAMDKNFSWTYIVIGALLAVGILGVLLLVRRRGPGHVHGRRGGL